MSINNEEQTEAIDKKMRKNIFYKIFTFLTGNKILASFIVVLGIIGGVITIYGFLFPQRFFSLLNGSQISGGSIGSPANQTTIVNLAGSQLVSNGSSSFLSVLKNPQGQPLFLYPIIVSIENNQLEISATVVGSDGKIIAQLNNDVLTVNNNQVLDWNYDNNAVEVIDQYGHIALQAEIVGNQVNLAGIFAGSNGDTYVIGPGFWTNGSVGGEIAWVGPGKAIPASYFAAFKKIFKYPSSLYLHQRATN